MVGSATHSEGMSVTFTLANRTFDCACSKAYAAGCFCNEYGVMRYCDHIHSVVESCACNDLSVNVSNTNAIAILERLGFDHPEDYLGGSCEADDFIGRTKLANVGRLDTGIIASVDSAPGRATMIDCGVRADYYSDVMVRLENLAHKAVAAGSEISWC